MAGRCKNIAKRLTGNMHLLSRSILIQPLEICKPDRFKLIERKINCFERDCRNFSRSKKPKLRIASYFSAFYGSCHIDSPLFLFPVAP
jgi:hypothetical protein